VLRAKERAEAITPGSHLIKEKAAAFQERMSAKMLSSLNASCNSFGRQNVRSIMRVGRPRNSSDCIHEEAEGRNYCYAGLVSRWLPTSSTSIGDTDENDHGVRIFFKNITAEEAAAGRRIWSEEAREA
jgi:hypothetical protein